MVLGCSVRRHIGLCDTLCNLRHVRNLIINNFIVWSIGTMVTVYLAMLSLTAQRSG